MDDVVSLACAALGLDAGRVVSSRVYPDRVGLVVDNGIAGCPKYSVPLSDLVQPEPEPEQAPKPKPWTPGRFAPQPNATAAAIREAGERGLDLFGIKGTGTDGRITLGDVKRAGKGAK